MVYNVCEEVDDRTFPITLDKDEETGWYVVTRPLLPICVSHGKTKEEALRNIRETVEGWIDVFLERLESGEFGALGVEIEVAV